MNFFDQVEKKRENLNRSENELLKYFIENAKDIKNMKIQDIANSTFFSTAGIIRFCKKLGFSGFSELKTNLSITVGEQNNNGYSQTHERNIPIFDDMDKTRKLINESIIDEIVDLINAANRIEFYGEGSSRSVSRETARHFQLIGKHAYYYDDTSIMYSSASSLGEQDLVFAISMSGETSQIIKAAGIAKTAKAKVISVTNMSMNTLSNLADKSLFVCSSRYSVKNMDFISRIPAVVLMEYVFYRYLQKYK